MKFISRKKLILGIALLFLIGGATVYVLAGELDGEQIMSLLGRADLIWLLPAGAAMLSFCLCEASNIRQGLVLSGYRLPFRKCILYALCGFFFSGITPSASGGQPAQLYFMNKDAIKLSHGTFSLMTQLIGFQIASVSLGIMGAVYAVNAGLLYSGNPVLWLFAAGFTVNLLWLMILICVMFMPRASMGLERLALSVLKKLHKSQDSLDRLSASFGEYRTAAGLLRRDKRRTLTVVLTAFFQLTFYNSIPYFCATALGLEAAAWFPCLCLQALLFLSASAIPLPGASGATEGGFAVFFALIFAGDQVGTLLILSRCLSFVLPLIISGAAIALVSLAGTVKKHRPSCK